jgi:hypothetical protein
LNKIKKDEKFDNKNKLKKLKISPVKFELKKLDDNDSVVVLNFPFKIKITNKNNFCKIWKFEKCIHSDTQLTPNTDYISENIKEIVQPFSVIEWH